MCDKEDDEMLIETPGHYSTPRKARKGTKQDRLNVISSSIDPSKLSKTKPLSFKENGQVDIDASHPDYNYWIKDED